MCWTKSEQNSEAFFAVGTRNFCFPSRFREKLVERRCWVAAVCVCVSLISGEHLLRNIQPMELGVKQMWHCHCSCVLVNQPAASWHHSLTEAKLFIWHRDNTQSIFHIHLHYNNQSECSNYLTSLLQVGCMTIKFSESYHQIGAL